MASLCEVYHEDCHVLQLIAIDNLSRVTASRTWYLNREQPNVTRLLQKMNQATVTNMHHLASTRNKVSGATAYTRQTGTTVGSGGKLNSSANQPCWKWNGYEHRAWTNTDRCGKDSAICAFKHVCSKCTGNHQRFTQAGCKFTQ
jgi:hypothetical protein